MKNPSAAKSLLDDIDYAYSELEDMAEAFAPCEDRVLREKHYRKLSLRRHDYLFIYRVEQNTVYIAGFFHMMENYQKKL